MSISNYRNLALNLREILGLTPVPVFARMVLVDKVLANDAQDVRVSSVRKLRSPSSILGYSCRLVAVTGGPRHRAPTVSLVTHRWMRQCAVTSRWRIFYAALTTRLAIIDVQ